MALRDRMTYLRRRGWQCGSSYGVTSLLVLFNVTTCSGTSRWNSISSPVCLNLGGASDSPPVFHAEFSVVTRDPSCLMLSVNRSDLMAVAYQIQQAVLSCSLPRGGVVVFEVRERQLARVDLYELSIGTHQACLLSEFERMAVSIRVFLARSGSRSHPAPACQCSDRSFTMRVPW